MIDERGERRVASRGCRASSATTVPSKNWGFVAVKRLATCSNVNARNWPSIEQAVVDQLPGLGEDTGDVGDVPVPDVRGEHGLELGPARVDARVEGEGVHRVVGLAAEVALPGEHVDDVVDRPQPALRPLVDPGPVLVGVRQEVEALAEPVDPRR